MADGTITIEFIDERVELVPPTSLTFGRDADLVIDEDNPHLHRVCGCIHWAGGRWWLDNVGPHVAMRVVGAGGSDTTLPADPDGRLPFRTCALLDQHTTISFRAGRFTYEVTCEQPEAVRPPGRITISPSDRETKPFGLIDLTIEERALLGVLAAGLLRAPGAGPECLPANKEAAAQLGWPLTRFNRKLDYLCERLAKTGVPGLKGTRGRESEARRWRLVTHAVSIGLVSEADVDG